MQSIDVIKNINKNKNDISNINYELSKTENTKYTTANGIKEFSCKDGYIDNVVIEGETLVNLLDISRGGNNTDNTKTYLFSYYSPSNCTVFNINGKSKIYASIHNKNSDTWVRDVIIEPNSNSNIVVPDTDYIKLYQIKFSDGWSSTDIDLAKKALVILEGDHTDKPISYFEGLKSVGQGDSIEVLTRGVNIFDGLYESGAVNSSGILAPNDLRERTINYILVEPNTKYYTPVTTNVYQYDYNKNFVGHIPLSGGGVFTTSDNTKYIKFYVDKGLMGTLQINKGESSLPYQKPQYDKKQISTTLRSIPNGVKDTIEKRGNKYVKVQRCGEYTINENSNLREWSAQAGATTKLYGLNGGISDAKPLSGVRAGTIFCNQYKSLNTIWDGIDANIGAVIDQNKVFSFRDLSSKFPTLDSVYTYLKSNPITVVYELETPIITELPNFNPQTFEGDTTLLINSGVIQANADFEVTNSMGSEIEVLKDKVSSLDDCIDKKDSAELTLLNGFQKAYGSDTIKVFRNGNMCVLQMSVKNISDVTSGTIIAKLPTGFIPKYYMRIFGCFGSGAQNVFNIDIATSGSIILYASYTANSQIIINATWEVE